MAPAFLVVGSTGNTGRSVVRTLSALLSSNDSFSNHKILAITRSESGRIPQQLSKLPSVEVVEKKWIDITADWLHEHNVERVFIATPATPSQFSEESALYLAALRAGVRYLVRVSTTAPNVRPDCPAYYARTHWALETLLSTPEFRGLQWTALQPNSFTALYLYSAAELVKEYRKTGKLGTLRLVAARDVPVGIIDADDVGTVAAHLLLEQDPSRHNKARYVLNGPVDITGREIVEMVEEHIGTQVQDISYQDTSFVEYMVAESPGYEHLVMSIKHAPDTLWKGECTASTTSKEVLEISPPRGTPRQVFEALLETGGSR